MLLGRQEKRDQSAKPAEVSNTAATPDCTETSRGTPRGRLLEGRSSHARERSEDRRAARCDGLAGHFFEIGLTEDSEGLAGQGQLLALLLEHGRAPKRALRCQREPTMPGRGGCALSDHLAGLLGIEDLAYAPRHPCCLPLFGCVGPAEERRVVPVEGGRP